MLRHLRVVGGNTRAELGLGTGMGDNTRVGLITGRAAWVPFGIHAWGPRIAWKRRVGMARGYGAWVWRAAWKWRVFLARHVDAAWKRCPGASLSLLLTFHPFSPNFCHAWLVVTIKNGKRKFILPPAIHVCRYWTAAISNRIT